MQFDYIEWLVQYGIYAVAVIGALILAILARNRYARTRLEGDSDRLQTPTYERMDSGITLSDPDDEDDP